MGTKGSKPTPHLKVLGNFYKADWGSFLSVTFSLGGVFFFFDWSYIWIIIRESLMRVRVADLFHTPDHRASSGGCHFVALTLLLYCYELWDILRMPICNCFAALYTSAWCELWIFFRHVFRYALIWYRITFSLFFFYSFSRVAWKYSYSRFSVIIH